jgi:Mitosis protein DIM1
MLFDIVTFILISANSRNKHIMIDLGTGNNNKMYVCELFALVDHAVDTWIVFFSNWAMDNKQEVRSTLYNIIVLLTHVIILVD